jgi:anthranilate phosphoribosyltransferase
VYAAQWVRPLAEVLARLGCERAWVVHGAGGLDELSTLGENTVAVVENGQVTERIITPEDAGLPRATLDQLKGGDSAYNAARLAALLNGERDAYRDIVLFGAAAALQIAGKVQELREGVTMAAAALDSGKARQTLDGLIRITNS